MVGRSGGGGRACGGGGGSGGARRRRTLKSAAAAVSRSSSSPTRAYDPEIGAKDPDYDDWYNTVSMEMRWSVALRGAEHSCPKDPNSLDCRCFMEMLVDYPQEKLKKYGLPTEIASTKPCLLVPVKVKDPMCSCNMWKSLLERCLNDNSHFDAQWKCVPFQGFVQDHCPTEKST